MAFRTLSLLVIYLEARAAERGKSIPASLLKTLIFMEHAAEIVKSEQISATPAVRNTLEEVKLELESVDGKPSRQAMHLPVALVMALEKAVMDLRFPRFLRGYAWFRLVKLWGCLRFNATVGLDFGSITLESFGRRPEQEQDIWSWQENQRAEGLHQ